jgi:hypothetical protein
MFVRFISRRLFNTKRTSGASTDLKSVFIAFNWFWGIILETFWHHGTLFFGPISEARFYKAAEAQQPPWGRGVFLNALGLESRLYVDDTYICIYLTYHIYL